MSGCPAHQITNHTKAAGDCSHEHAFYNFSSYDISRLQSIGAVIVWIVVSMEISYRKSQSNSIKRVQKVSALLEVLREWVSHFFPSTTGRHWFCPLRRTQAIRRHLGSRWYQKQPMKLDLRMLLLITKSAPTVSSSMSSLPNKHKFSTVVESAPSMKNGMYISSTEFKLRATQMTLLHHSQITTLGIAFLGGIGFEQARSCKHKVSCRWTSSTSHAKSKVSEWIHRSDPACLLAAF